MGTPDLYARWRAELAGEREAERHNIPPANGFYRMDGARTKPSWPTAIWSHPESGKTLVRVGGRDIEPESVEFHEFAETGGWLKCVSVPKSEYDAARSTGFWSDGKPAKQMDDATKLGIDVSTGGNNPPIETAIEDQISAAVDTAKKITKVTSADEARKANEMAERLAGLFKLGDAERDKQKRPHDEASKAVQARWLPIINPAEDERKRVIALAKGWLKAEEARLAAEAETERKRLQAIADAENEKIEAENKRRIENAAPMADVQLVAPVAAPVVEAPKVQAASTFGRATGLRTVKRAKITDIGKLLIALSMHKEMIEFAQTLANRAAKAGITLDGMTIEEIRE